jgi:hypothetical protein
VLRLNVSACAAVQSKIMINKSRFILSPVAGLSVSSYGIHVSDGRHVVR